MFVNLLSLSLELVLIVLWDGRHIIGTLSSYDQYGSLVLEKSKERHFAQGKYCDIDMGIYLIRGENIALIGEIDPVVDASNPLLVPASWDEVQQLEKEEEQKEKEKYTKKLTTSTVSSSSSSNVTTSAPIATGGETIIRSGWRME